MPFTRRLRLTGLLVLIVFFVTFYVTSGARQTRNSAFYTKTQDALAQQREAKEASLGSKDSAPDLAPHQEAMAERLRDAEIAAKEAADRKAEEFHGEEVVEDKKKEKEAMDRQQAKGAAKKGDAKANDAGKKSEADTEEERKVKDELNSILKRSPIIIFSKSYCPFSRRAKDILLHSYKITPPPVVVELDEHPLGPVLQAKLADITGRRTVPNILVRGKSIGGGDEVQALHQEGKLVETIRSMLGKQAEIVPVKADPKGDEKEKVMQKKEQQREKDTK